MINYKEALTRPFLDIQKYLIGILLSIIPIVSFFALGYQLEAARLSMRKKHELPEWKGFTKLFVDGLSAVIISLFYFLPAIIILIIAIGMSPSYDLLKTAIINTDPVSMQAFISSLGPLLFVFGFLWLVASYLLPVAILSYADGRKFMHAFRMVKVIGIAFNKKYPGPWIIATIISLLLSYVLGFLPYIGYAISSFTGGMISYTILGIVYGESRYSL